MSGIKYCSKRPDILNGQIAVIDGKENMNAADFLHNIWEQLKFPDSQNCNRDAYLDWMRDLSWIRTKTISIVIENYDAFLSKDQSAKDFFVSDLEKTIFPFWSNDAAAVFDNDIAIKDITVFCLNGDAAASNSESAEQQLLQQPAPEIPVSQNDFLKKLEELHTAIAGLQQTFDDKIVEDEHKNSLFDNMHRELIRYQNGAIEKIIDTMALDIIQLVDSTKGHVRVYEKKEPTEDSYRRLLRIIKGITEDLQDILYRQNIEAYRVEGHAVDVRRQKIIQTVPTDDKNKDNVVAVRVADGYEKEGRILRPERIKIFKYSPAATDTSDN